MKILSIYIFLFVGLTSFGQSNLGKNKKAPTFSFKDTYGAIITPNSFKGKVLYIDVWATWCKPCLKGFKSFNELQNKYSEAEIAFMGVSIDESEGLWRNTLMKESPKGTQVLAENGAASQIISDYNIARFPHYVLIDQNGHLIEANAPKPDSQELDDLLNRLLKKNRQQIYNPINLKKAPLFSFKDTYGAILTANSFKGKILYIHVWAEESRKESKEFNQLYNKFKNHKNKNEIAFMGVSIEQSETRWKRLLTKSPLKGVQVIAENGSASRIVSDYSISRFPRYILIDQNGNIVNANAPAPESEELEKILQVLLSEI